ncbi:Gfo/Idh/MocA family protein [Microbacterium tumbae]
MSGIAVAVVGVGGIGRAHIRAILEDPDLRLAGMVTRTPERLAGLAVEIAGEQGDAPWIAKDLEEGLAARDADLVVICTESGRHATDAETAIRSGRHVLVEKPVATTLAGARRLTDLVAAGPRQRLVSVVSQRRFSPGAARLAGLVRSGGLGRITSASIVLPGWRGEEYFTNRPWRGTWAGDGGGALFNQGVHQMDLLGWLLGAPTSVTGLTATVAHDGIETEDTAGALIRFPGDVIATVLATTAAHPGSPAELRIHGTKASELLVDGAPGAGGFPGEVAVTSGGARSQIQQDLAVQYRDVIEAIRDGRPPAVGLADAVRALSLVKATYVSARLGAPVAFEDVLSGALDHLDPAGA